MKHCPECNRNYADPTLSFCLQDGAPLIFGAAADEAPTALLTGDRPGEAATRTLEPAPTSPPPAALVATNRRSIVVGVLGILLVTALGLGSYLYYGRGSSKQIDSIAVLPFANATGDKDAEFLGDGISETLINTFTKIPGLKVAARTTAFRYRGREGEPQTIGRELGVGVVLAGTLLQRGDDLSVQVDLVSTTDGVQIWGNRYSGRSSDIVNIQQRIATDVSEHLRLNLNGTQAQQVSKAYTKDPDAYQLYLRGRHLWTKRTPESIRKAIEYFNQAIEKDPGFARAYSGLADAYVVPGGAFAPAEAMPKAKVAALRALEIDGTLAEAHNSLARVLQVYDWNRAEAEKEYKKALALDPHYPVAHQWYGGFLEKAGNFNDSISERKRALELDPLSAATNFDLAQAYYWSRDYDQAIVQFQKTLELEEHFSAASNYLLGAYVQKGRHADALAKLGTITNFPPVPSIGLVGYVYGVTGRTKEARNMLAELIRLRGQQYISPVDIAMIHVGLGEKDEAVKWLEKGYEERAYAMQNLKIEPSWDGLRDDPRFADLVRRVGLSN
jgi:TolB-like protein/tetratricopeptide (TPR) repeat protein